MDLSSDGKIALSITGGTKTQGIMSWGRPREKVMTREVRPLEIRSWETCYYSNCKTRGPLVPLVGAIEDMQVQCLSMVPCK